MLRWLVGAVLFALAACASVRPEDPDERVRWLVAESGGLSDAALRRLLGDMNPAARAVALRFDPARHPRLWGRPVGWAVYDLDDLRGALRPDFRGRSPRGDLSAVRLILSDLDKR